MSFLLICAALVVGLVDCCPTNRTSAVGRAYVEALEKAGHVPVALPRITDRALIGAAVDRVDLVFLCGGEDVNPSRYGQAKSPRCERINEVRDVYEWAVLDACVKVRKPVFGVCRGEQIINCYFGGTLIQDINTEVSGVRRHRYAPSEKPDYIDHDVEVIEGSRLAAVLGCSGTVSAKAWHHQAVGRLAPGFRVSARSADGIVEAIESDSYPAAGVQFHPEMNVKADPSNRFVALFRALPSLCGAAGRN